MSVFVGGYKWIGLTVATLVLSFLLSGCHEGDFTFHLIQDTRIPSPEAVVVLEEIEAETGEACIDLMEADVETLQLITNIGPYRAQYITDLRNLFTFESADDLRIVPGIGERRLQQIIDQGIVCLGD